MKVAVLSDMLDRAWTRFTFNIWVLQNPTCRNELILDEVPQPNSHRPFECGDS